MTSRWLETRLAEVEGERDWFRALAEAAEQSFHDAAKLGNDRWHITRYCKHLETQMHQALRKKPIE